MSALDAENVPHLSAAELEKVRVFRLHRPSRIFDDGDGIRFGFLILAFMVAVLVALGVTIVAVIELMRP